MATAVALGACSGEAEAVPVSEGGLGHAGAASRVPATPRYLTGGGQGGDAGADVGAPGGTAVAPVSGGRGGIESGLAGVGGASTADLGLLEGNTFLYQITHEWQPDNVAEYPQDSEYVPVDVDAAIHVVFSSDATQLEMFESEISDPVYGQRSTSDPGRVRYSLDLFAGGYFDVWANGSDLAAEHTVYGSGVRVISSTRGVLLLVHQ
jgi:hypothetical protein